jgi:RNA polymerase sigma factor (sigma-70 family)
VFRDLAGNQRAGQLERVLAERGDRLMAIAIALCGNRADAEDLLQAALERMLRHRPGVTLDIEAYLRRTLYNLAADGWRRRGAWRRKIPLLRAEHRAAAGADGTAAVDLRDMLVRLLIQLPPRQRAVIVLRYWEQLSEAEAAEVLGCSEGTIKSAATTAYVVRHVESALARENLVMRGQATQTYTLSQFPGKTFPAGTTISWAYGQRSQFEEFTGNSCGHVRPNGACTHRGGSERYLASGTALVAGKLTGAYVTYYDHKFSLGPVTAPARACSTTTRLAMGGPLTGISDWRTFITTMLGCGAATVTGHARVDGLETTEISGSVTVPLSRGYAKTVKEKVARVRYTLWVNPATYLPVRVSGSTATYGGPGGRTHSSTATDVQWLPPTAANVAQTLVTIPAGYQQVSSAADQ